MVVFARQSDAVVVHADEREIKFLMKSEVGPSGSLFGSVFGQSRGGIGG